jgi:hypothetical protein
MESSYPNEFSILTYYKLLEETPLSSLSDIQRAYKIRALQCHPDKGGSSEQFIELTTAYQTILQFHTLLQHSILHTSSFIQLSPEYLLHIIDTTCQYFL